MEIEEPQKTISVMGAKILVVLDTIVCGNAEKETLKFFSKDNILDGSAI